LQVTSSRLQRERLIIRESVPTNIKLQTSNLRRVAGYKFQVATGEADDPGECAEKPKIQN